MKKLHGLWIFITFPFVVASGFLKRSHELKSDSAIDAGGPKIQMSKSKSKSESAKSQHARAYKASNHRATFESTIDVEDPSFWLSKSKSKSKHGAANPRHRIDKDAGVGSKTKRDGAMLQHARANKVREAIRHLWSGYRKAGWGADEIQPMSGKPRESLGKVGMLILDTLDTLWLAGLHDEFAEGEKWVSELDFQPRKNSTRSSFFEIVIRGLAGLLSAYALSGHHVLLDKARLLGDQLLQGFPKPGSVHLWPVATIDVHNASDVGIVADWHPSFSYLADVGSNVLEFSYLSDATGDSRYQSAAGHVFNKLVKLSNSFQQPLLPLELDPYSFTFRGDTVSVGATGDSYFEYLLKRYLQSGCTEHQLLSTWKNAMHEMREALIKESPQGLTYIQSQATRVAPGVFGPAAIGMEHLSCYVGGMLAMASHYVPAEDAEDWWLPRAVEITQTCYQMYQLTPTGLAPENVIFDETGMRTGETHYRLRPETLESLFYLYRITGNTTYRDWSYNIFEAINRKTKTKYGFATVNDVSDVNSLLDDDEETWMGAETLKYALLTQLPARALPLDEFVLNTEAHPFPAVCK